MTTRPIATQFPGHGCMYYLTTERTFDSQAKLVNDVLGLFSYVLYIGVDIPRHWQTSSRPLQELNVCTVP